MNEKPPLGMVPYLPTHNHQSETPSGFDACGPGCPVYDWEQHVEKHGNPYPRPKQIEDYFRRLTPEECVKLGGHCHVSDNIVLTSNPPQYPETCKHCGHKRIGTPQPAMSYRDA